MTEQMITDQIGLQASKNIQQQIWLEVRVIIPT